MNRTRVVLMTAVFALAAAALVAATRASTAWPAHEAFALAFGAVLIPLVASPLEWCVHRFVYHEAVIGLLRPIFVVHTAHHFVYFPTWRYVTGGPPRRLAIRRGSPVVHRTPAGNARVRLAHFSWYMAIGAVGVWAPVWALSRDGWLLAGMVTSSAVVSNLFIVVHDTIHRPGSHRFVEAQPWFAFLDRHHYLHHIDLGANLNFLLPLADLAYGTLRLRPTPAEQRGHGSLARAKAHPLGEGEPAREAARAC
ncbi:MAG: hypothetical protein ACKVWR_15835 [Acidimicrobiales bacterium]